MLKLLSVQHFINSVGLTFGSARHVPLDQGSSMHYPSSIPACSSSSRLFKGSPKEVNMLYVITYLSYVIHALCCISLMSCMLYVILYTPCVVQRTCATTCLNCLMLQHAYGVHRLCDAQFIASMPYTIHAFCMSCLRN